MAAVPFVSEKTFEVEVLREELPVLVEFGAEWCGPCKTVAPELEAVHRELAGKAKIVQVDIDKSPMLAQTLGIRSVPTFIVFHQGQPVNGKQGAIRKAEMLALLEPYLPRAAGALKPLEVQQLAAARRIVLVDTRPPEVFARAHIHGAINAPLAELRDDPERLLALPGPAVLYCRGGKETEQLAAELGEKGLPVAFLEGGVLGWEAEGLKLERP
ncbi:MAG TPA: thioredoxin domain-containing protein [Polyangiaceae bacterium]|nr:thioredoxin domain-containing protein [Polyangiaceae bacterium]